MRMRLKKIVFLLSQILLRTRMAVSGGSWKMANGITTVQICVALIVSIIIMMNAVV